MRVNLRDRGTRIRVLAILLAIGTGYLIWRLMQPEPFTEHPDAYTEDRTVHALKPRTGIIDVHEHLQTEADAARLLKVMDDNGVAKAALMASTTFTFTLDSQYGFEGFKENGETLLAIKRTWPDRFLAFVTFDPCDGTDHLAYLQDAVSRGADGIKMYLGHGGKPKKFEFHCRPLNDAGLDAFWSWAEAEQVPLMVHVNLRLFYPEFKAVMERHPNLRVTLPHYGLSMFGSGYRRRLSELLEEYPNLYLDVSFGSPEIQLQGFERTGEIHDTVRAFIVAHSDRVMFGSDMVITPEIETEYIERTLRSYRELLELPSFIFDMRPNMPLKGLALDEATLRQIYEQTPRAFLQLPAEAAAAR